VSTFVRYEHHGKLVWVRGGLKHEHYEYCLCIHCTKLKPNQADNCERAQNLFDFDVANDMVTPVWECPEFEELREAMPKWAAS